MQPIHIAAMIGCSEILKYIGTLPGVNLNAVVSSPVKYWMLYSYLQTWLIQINNDTYVCSYVHMYVCMCIYFVRITFRLYTLLVRWDTHPVSECLLKTAMLIPTAGLRYIRTCTHTYIRNWFNTFQSFK